MMNNQQKYYLNLLRSRAKRLNEMLEIAAPPDMIYKEIMLLTDAARPFAPQPQWGGYGGTWENQNEESQGYQRQCATG